MLLCMLYFVVSAHGLTTSDDHYVASKVVCWDRRSGAVIVGLRCAGVSTYSLTPSTSFSTCMASAAARAMRVRRRAFIGVPGRDSPFSNFW